MSVSPSSWEFALLVALPDHPPRPFISSISAHGPGGTAGLSGWPQLGNCSLCGGSAAGPQPAMPCMSWSQSGGAGLALQFGGMLSCGTPSWYCSPYSPQTARWSRSAPFGWPS